MGKLSLSLLVLALCVGLGKAGFSDCPLLACTAIHHPDSCRAVTFFIDAADNKGQVCQGCNACIERVNDDMLVNGCPLRACTLQLIPKRCRRDRYFIYQRRTVCKDCPEDIC